MKRAPTIVGVDTGGTFTDLIAVVDGTVRTHKLLSTPRNPATAVLRGLRELLPESVPRLVTYGSTVATNALLERRGARVVLLTTAGFEDIIEIGRQQRPALYDLEPQRPLPLVERAHRLGVDERTLHDGTVLRPLDPHNLDALVRRLRRHRPDAVAVCFLHAYANPHHERIVGAALARHPDLFCSLSHELISEHREYERTSTTVINAYVGPVVSRHLAELESGLGASGLPPTRLRVMQSNGGTITARLAGRQAVRTALSGPAAGVIGAWSVARALRLTRVITFDMGGTSTDVSLIDGALRYRSEWDIGGLPVKIPAIDIHTVGAGGGSLVHVDAGQALKVGPSSAGADPGPACYGKGTLATVTDANVVLGRVAADAFLGGRMQLDVRRARSALARIGTILGTTVERAALGITKVITATMERALRTVSVERGYAPREYTMIAFGGAAGQHACELSTTLGIHRVVVPRHPGLLSAWGAATADVQRDYVHTVRLRNPAWQRLRALYLPLEHAARRELEAEGVPRSQWQLRRAVDVRYVGQSHELSLPVTRRIAETFHTAHRHLYGYADLQRPVEVVNIRLLAVGRGPRAHRTRVLSAARQSPRRGRVYWAGRWMPVPTYQRPQLAAATRLDGPALITEFSATTFVPPGWRARVHPAGHLVLTHAD